MNNDVTSALGGALGGADGGGNGASLVLGGGDVGVRIACSWFEAMVVRDAALQGSGLLGCCATMTYSLALTVLLVRDAVWHELLRVEDRDSLLFDDVDVYG